MSYNQALPFSHDRLNSNPMQFRLDQPPLIPNVQCPQNLQYLLPAVCAMVANEAASKCNLHPGRTFMYNQLASNNFANNEFGMCVATTLDYLALNLYKQIYRSAEEGLTDAVSKVLSIFCSLNFQTYPPLQSVTNPSIVNDAAGNIQAFAGLNNEIANFKNRVAQQPFPQTMQPQFQQPQQMMINPAFAGGGYNPQHQQPVQQFQQPANTGGLFNNSGNQAPGQPINQSSPVITDGGKYDYLKRSEPVAAILDQKSYFVNKGPIAYPVTGNNATAVAYPHVPDTQQLVWKPSKDQPYPVTIDPRTQKYCLREDFVDGKQIVISYIEPLSGAEMDRAQHTITTMKQVLTAHIPASHGTREEAFSDSVDEIFKIKGTDLVSARHFDNILEEEASLEIQTHVRPSWGLDTFLEAAIFNGRFAHQQSKIVDVECTAFRIYTVMCKPIIGTSSHVEFISDLAKSKSFRELAAKLSETLTVYSENRSLVKLCYEIEKLLTDEVNSVLRNRMSLIDNIDSFIDDINDIPAHLAKHYGDMYSRIFLEFQKNYIGIMLGVIDDENALGLTEQLFAEPDDKVVINFISQNYSITFLNVVESELGIKPVDTCASSLLESVNPLMWRVAKGIFTQENDFDQEALHHLVITSDDVIFEIHEGLIGEDFYTISKQN